MTFEYEDVFLSNLYRHEETNKYVILAERVLIGGLFAELLGCNSYSKTCLHILWLRHDTCSLIHFGGGAG